MVKTGVLARMPTKTKTELLREFVNLAQDLQRIPSVNDINQAARSGRCAWHTTYFRHFLTIRGLCEEIGLPFNLKGRGSYTDDDLIGQLVKLRAKLQRRVTLEDVKKAAREKEGAQICSFKRVFGSVSIALLKAEREYHESLAEEL